MREPSKYKTDAAERLIGHWRDRESDLLMPLAFKAYKGKDGVLVKSAAPSDDLIRMPDGVEGEFSWLKQIISDGVWL
jgi:hypothetical protein